MYIQHIELHQYKPFDFSNIKTLSIDFTSPVTVIMGTNGSGKSSLLREITPLPASRPDYHKDGYKQLQIVHNDQQFTLISDFNNRVSPHSFLLEDKELNISGTTKVQEELVEKYLGYTSDIRKMTHMGIDICRMGPAERKNYFINTNTVDLSFILQKHKKVVSKIRECRANLSHLYARKADIESKLLSKENYELLLKRQDELSTLSVDIDKVVYALNLHITQLRESMVPYQRDYPYDIQEHMNWVIFNAVHTVMDLSDVDRATVSTEDIAIQTQLLQLQAQLTELDTELQKVCADINTNTVNIQECDVSKPKLLEQQILALDKELKELVVSSELTIVPNIESSKLHLLSVSNEIRSLIDPLLHYSGKIWSIDTFVKARYISERLSAELNSLTTNHEKMTREYTELTVASKEVIAPIPKGCTDDTCQVRTTLLNKLKSMSVDLEKLNKQISSTTQVLSKLRFRHTKLVEKLSTQEPYIRILDKLKCLRNNDKLVASILTEDQLMKYLHTSPLQIIHHIQNTIVNTERYNLRQERLEQKQKLVSELDKAKLSSQLSIEYLQKQQVGLEESRDKLLNKYKDIESTIQRLSVKLQSIEKYKQLRNELEDNDKLLESYLQYSMLDASIKFHTEMLNKCNTKKLELTTELANIQASVKEQKSLRDRYDEEVVKHIVVYEQQLKDYIQLESALSPNSGIPHRYTVKYINSLIKNVGYFISQVFTYPLLVKSLDETSSIDFNLPVLVDEVLVRDINRLSKGQSEIMNFAWTLSILYHLKVLHLYPVILDEIGTGFDPRHTQKFIEFLYELIDQKYISQTFLVNHGAVIASGFVNSNIVCLKTDNVLLPEVYNTDVSIEKYS